MQVFASSWVSLRQPAADRDSLVLLGQPVDTESVVASLGPTVMGFCPDGVASMSLPYVAASPDPMTAGRYPAPLLVSEVMEIRGYESGGEWWVGVRSVSSGEVIQPAHGPIGDGGLRITAHDSTGTVTSVPSLISHLLFMVKVPSGDSTVIHLDVTRGTWR